MAANATGDDADHHVCDLRPGSDRRANAIHARRRHAIGMELHEQGRPDEALRAYYEAEVLDPRNPGILCDIGRAYLDLGLFKRALAAFGIVLEADPDNVQASLGRANTYRLLGAHDKALRCFEVVTRLSPQNPGAHLGRGRSLAALGRNVEALEALASCVKLVPDDAALHVHMGRILLLLGRPVAALDVLAHAASLSPDDSNIHFERYVVLSVLGRHREALGALRRSLSPSSTCTDPQICRICDPQSPGMCHTAPSRTGHKLDTPPLPRVPTNLPALHKAGNTLPETRGTRDLGTRSNPRIYHLIRILYRLIASYDLDQISRIIPYILQLFEL